MKRSDLESSAHAHFYATYINTLKDVELIEAMRQGEREMQDFLSSLPLEKLHYAYASDKWTIAEVLMHVIDTERVFQYRAFCFSRRDKTELPGFDQDAYVLESNSQKRNKEDILSEYLAVRQATLSLYTSLKEEQLLNTGTASRIPWSVGALGFVISGHQKHHLNILKERYL